VKFYISNGGLIVFESYLRRVLLRFSNNITVKSNISFSSPVFSLLFSRICSCFRNGKKRVRVRSISSFHALLHWRSVHFSWFNFTVHLFPSFLTWREKRSELSKNLAKKKVSRNSTNLVHAEGEICRIFLESIEEK